MSGKSVPHNFKNEASAYLKLSFNFQVGIDVHEIVTLEHTHMCKEAGMTPFTAWTYISVYVSHFCLVANATLNMYIYCFMSTLFRDEVRQVLKQDLKGFCKTKSDSQG